ncbi:MAG TPA: FecR domain-containing protein [Steroidobacteraceae bacterium]|jgi:transmembrane sensor|nr:FecR domain-containing protein [Steroidobacteraceae bacterium]
MDRLLQPHFEHDPLLEEAAEWFIALRSDGVSGERIAEWQHWLSSDEAHRQAFQRLESFWQLSDGVAARWPTEDEVKQDEYSGTESVTAWRSRHRTVAPERREPRATSAVRARPFGWLLVGAPLAAIIAFAAVVYWPLIEVTIQGGWQTSIQTGIGETRTLTLPDGTTVSAGGETSLVATLLPHSRTVVLSRGDAYFQVAREPGRPFTVRAGSTTVTDIGTAFDVKVLDGVIVSVAEGMVGVSAKVMTNPDIVQLGAGKSIALQAFNKVSVVTTVNPAEVGGWRQGRLQYVDEPLAGVVADLSRYSTRRIIVGDAHVANLRVTGIVFLDNINGWLASLESTFRVNVATEGDGTVLIEPRDSVVHIVRNSTR